MNGTNGKINVLLIEDDRVDVMIFERALQKSGLDFLLTVCYDFQQASEQLNSTNNSIDCIFLDYMLPGGDAKEILDLIRLLELRIPVAVLTSQGDEKIAVQMMKMGAFDYFPKAELSPDKLARTVFAMVGMVQLNREKRKAELELREKDLLIKKITDSSPNLIYVFDIVEELNVYYNRVLHTMLKYSEEDIKVFGNQFFSSVIHPDDIEAVHKYHLAMVDAKDDEIRMIEYRIRRKDGIYIWLHSRDTVFLRDTNGKVVQVLGTAIDNTAQKENEAELIKAKQMAEIAAKVKSEFLSNMSHEIRTPMNAIIGLADILLQDKLQGQVLENVKSIKQSANNLLVIINDILDFSKIEAGKVNLESIDFSLRDLLVQLNKTLDFQVESKGISLTFEMADEVPDILIGDPYRLNQILLNITGNAVKFTESGGVTVKINLLQLHQNLVRLLFVIEDTGIGIAKDKLDGIFESFTQAHSIGINSYGGTGLGLAITKHLVALQNGTISVESDEGKGSAFSIELAYEISQKENLDDIEGVSTTQDNLGGARILVMEDNPMNKLVVRQVLEKWQCDFEIYENGKLGLEAFENSEFDLVLMDLQMPVMDGFEATSKIRQVEAGSQSRIPILALTANAFPETKAKVLSSGMDDFITKPFNLAELYQKLDKFLRQ